MDHDARIRMLETELTNLRKERFQLRMAELGLGKAAIAAAISVEFGAAQVSQYNEAHGQVVVPIIRSVCATKPIAKTVSDTDLTERILEVLDDGPKQRGEITRLSGGTVSGVQNALNKLRKNGYVKLVGDKAKATWHLVEEEEVAS